MNELVVGGIDFDGDLPGDWTVRQLVSVLETNVLQGDELVTGVQVDGREGFGEAANLRLDDAGRVVVEVQRATQVVEDAIARADAARAQVHEALDAAVAAFQVGREHEGWEAHQRGLGALLSFVDLTERLTGILAAGIGPGPHAAGRLQALAQELMPRLAMEEQATQQGDLLALCDAMDELNAWLGDTWAAVWAAPDAGMGAVA